MHLIFVFAIAVTSALQSHIGGNVTLQLHARLVKNIIVGPQTLLVVSKDFLAVRADEKNACRPIFVAPDVIAGYTTLGKPQFTPAAPISALFRGSVPTRWTSLFVNARFPFDIYDRDGYLICRSCAVKSPSAVGVLVDTVEIGPKTSTRLARPRYIRYEDVGAVEYDATC